MLIWEHFVIRKDQTHVCDMFFFNVFFKFRFQCFECLLSKNKVLSVTMNEIFDPFFFITVSEMDYENESPPEVYHHLLQHNRHIVYEIKLSLILILGSVIILICVMYIVSQCKRKIAAERKWAKNRCSNCDKKALLRHSPEVSQMLTDNEIIGQTKISKEFFV